MRAVAPRNGAQSSRVTRVARHHGAVNSALRNTPLLRRAALRTSDKACIGRLQLSGVSVIPSGVLIIAAADHGEYIVATSGWSHRPPGSKSGDRHECDRKY